MFFKEEENQICQSKAKRLAMESEARARLAFKSTLLNLVQQRKEETLKEARVIKGDLYELGDKLVKRSASLS
jgi:hypothetical protein